MTLAEFYAVMDGVALRNGHKREPDAPSDDDFYADLAIAMAKGEA